MGYFFKKIKIEKNKIKRKKGSKWRKRKRKMRKSIDQEQPILYVHHNIYCWNALHSKIFFSDLADSV